MLLCLREGTAISFFRHPVYEPFGVQVEHEAVVARLNEVQQQVQVQEAHLSTVGASQQELVGRMATSTSVATEAARSAQAELADVRSAVGAVRDRLDKVRLPSMLQL